MNTYMNIKYLKLNYFMFPQQFPQQFPIPGLGDVDLGSDFYPKSQISEPLEAKKLFIKNIP